MNTFIETIDAEVSVIEAEQAEIAARRDQLEARRERLLDLRVLYNGDGPAPIADPPPVAKPKRSVKKIVPARSETKPVASKKIERADVEADQPIARSKVIEGMKLKVTYSVVGDAIDALMERGEVERIGERAGTRYGVPQRTVNPQQPARPPVIPSSSTQRPAPKDGAATGAEYVAKVRQVVKDHGPISPAAVREKTGIGQGGLVQAAAKLRQAGVIKTVGQGRGTKYVYIDETERGSASNGKPAPPPPPARTALQDRLVTLIGVKPLTTKELWEELGEIPLKVEGALSALEQREEVERTDGMWYLA